MSAAKASPLVKMSSSELKKKQAPSQMCQIYEDSETQNISIMITVERRMSSEYLITLQK